MKTDKTNFPIGENIPCELAYCEYEDGMRSFTIRHKSTETGQSFYDRYWLPKQDHEKYEEDKSKFIRNLVQIAKTVELSRDDITISKDMDHEELLEMVQSFCKLLRQRIGVSYFLKTRVREYNDTYYTTRGYYPAIMKDPEMSYVHNENALNNAIVAKDATEQQIEKVVEDVKTESVAAGSLDDLPF